MYEFVPASELAGLREAIRQILTGNSYDKDMHYCKITPESGWIYYADKSQLFSDRQSPPSLAATAEQAAKQIQGELERLTTACQASPLYTSEPFIPPLRFLREHEPVVVDHPKTGMPDHWLQQFQLVMPVSSSPKASALVIGAGLDVRIGSGGRIIGLSTRQRPIARRITQDFFIDLNSATLALLSKAVAEHASHSHSDDHSHSGEAHNHLQALPDKEWLERNMVYLMPGQQMEQSHLMPMFYEGDGHGFMAVPATKDSFSVKIMYHETKDHFKQVLVLAVGGSGEFEYEVSDFPLTSSQNISLIEPVSKNEFVIEQKGMHVVYAKVTGINTEIVMSTRENILVYGRDMTDTGEPLSDPRQDKVIVS